MSPKSPKNPKNPKNTMRVGDKIKILKSNPEKAGPVRKGDVGTVDSFYETGFNYTVDEYYWSASFNQEGKTWSLILTKEAKTFKVGERVVVYDSRLIGLRQVAIVSELRDPNGFYKKALVVKDIKRSDYDYEELIVHPSQVRKLRKKA